MESFMSLCFFCLTSWTISSVFCSELFLTSSYQKPLRILFLWFLLSLPDIIVYLNNISGNSHSFVCRASLLLLSVLLISKNGPLLINSDVPEITHLFSLDQINITLILQFFCCWNQIIEKFKLTPDPVSQGPEVL